MDSVSENDEPIPEISDRWFKEPPPEFLHLSSTVFIELGNLLTGYNLEDTNEEALRRVCCGLIDVSIDPGEQETNSRTLNKNLAVLLFEAIHESLPLPPVPMYVLDAMFLALHLHVD